MLKVTHLSRRGEPLVSRNGRELLGFARVEIHPSYIRTLSPFLVPRPDHRPHNPYDVLPSGNVAVSVAVCKKGEKVWCQMPNHPDDDLGRRHQSVVLTQVGQMTLNHLVRERLDAFDSETTHEQGESL